MYKVNYKTLRGLQG